MKTICTLMSMIGLAACASGQWVQFYHNPKLLAAMTENQGIRSGAELALNEQAKAIRNSTIAINANMAVVWATKDLIYRSLTDVDEVLKDGREIGHIGGLLSDMFAEAREMTLLADKVPRYAPLIRSGAQKATKQAVDLFNEIARFVNKGGQEAMMDHNTRDELLRDIGHRLQLMLADMAIMRQSVQWAGAHERWNSLGPFAEWANRDRQIMDDILRKAEQIRY